MPDSAVNALHAGRSAPAAPARTRRQVPARDLRKIGWIVLLLAATCFEGVGRKYVSFIPQSVFYLLKDVLLVAGLLTIGVNARVRTAAGELLRGFGFVLGIGLVWTVLEVANPASPSLPLGLLGLKAYWLWWLAPLVVATAFRTGLGREIIPSALGIIAILVAGYGAYQFGSPAGSAATQYAGYEGWLDPAGVVSTGRARVASTFAYVSGFAAFGVVVPPVLLWLGLRAVTPRARFLAFAGAAGTLIGTPMSGSRSVTILAAAAMAIVLWRAGLLRTRAGRRVAAVAGVTMLATAWFVPDAARGVRDRFDTEETTGRIVGALIDLTPARMVLSEYPILGTGTGSQHNAAAILGQSGQWKTESEPDRYLVELGLPGFVLMYVRRVGLALAMVRLSRRLHRLGQAPASGVSLVLALLAMTSNIVFDHVFQALFFLAAGLLVAEIVPVQTTSSPAPGRVGGRLVATR